MVRKSKFMGQLKAKLKKFKTKNQHAKNIEIQKLKLNNIETKLKELEV
jgi:hypothetical protein